MPEEVLDFTDVKEGFQGLRVAEADYGFVIAEVDQHAKSKAGNRMWVFKHEFLSGPHKGERLTDRVSLTPQALFRLRDLLEAIGLKVGRKKIKIDPEKLKGKTFGAHVQDGEPFGEKNRITSEIGYYMPLANVVEGPPEEPATDNLAASAAEKAVTGEQTTSDEDAALEGALAEPAKPDPEESSDVADQLESFDLDAL